MIVPNCFSMLWNSDAFRTQIESSARTTAGIYKINQGLVCKFRFPVTGLNEQQEIVRILKSILKKAFSGQLVPQDPNDEPASLLLERIREERAAAETKRKPASRAPGKGVHKKHPLP